MRFSVLLAIGALATTSAITVHQKSADMSDDAEADGDAGSPDLQANVQAFADKLGIPMSDEILQLGSNEAISSKLVEIALENGKTEAEIGAALGDQ